MSQQNPRSKDELVLAVRKGFRPRYLFFWGHKPLPNNVIGPSCFSQWWPARFVVDEIEYLTAEHFMMAEKARLFEDYEVRNQILNAGSPKLAKQLGRNVRNFKDDVWQESRFQIVVRGNLEKFRQNRELRDYLLRSGNKVLVEASPVDRIWGIGLGQDDKRAKNPETWVGLNLLGFALIEVRQRLLEG
jgi:ribA/ribD-fused uncharacterized protein